MKGSYFLYGTLIPMDLFMDCAQDLGFENPQCYSEEHVNSAIEFVEKKTGLIVVDMCSCQEDAAIGVEIEKADDNLTIGEFKSKTKQTIENFLGFEETMGFFEADSEW